MEKTLWAVDINNLRKCGCPYCRSQDTVIEGRLLVMPKICPHCQGTFLAVNIRSVHERLQKGESVGCRVIMKNGQMQFSVPIVDTATGERRTQTFVLGQLVRKEAAPRQQQTTA